MHQSVVEMGTDICEDIHDARKQVTKLRRDLAGLAKKNNLRIAASGTHPFSHWKDRRLLLIQGIRLLLKICSRWQELILFRTSCACGAR